jgi:hypothetical protein
MPVRHITGQGEVYSDIEEPKKEEPLKYIPGIHGPKTKEQEELEKSLREPKGTPVEPIAPFPPLVTPIPKQEKEKPEGLPIPTQEKEKPEGLPIPEQKTWRDYVLTQDKPKDITKQTTDHRLQHKPRGPDDEYPVRLDNLTQTTTGESAGYPKDFYSGEGKRMYAPGPSFEGDEFGIANTESYNIINSVKGNPDAEVTIYRAVPNEKNITKINPGDFVTLSKRYADLHAAGGYGRDGTDSGKVLELKVKVKDIYWDQNDVNEFGYFPEKTKDITKQTEELVKKELSVSQQTKNLTSKIKNEITTWEDHFPTIEEATKAAKDVGGTLREFEEGLIEKKITFRKTGDGLGFEIYFDKKFVGELSEVDPYKEDPIRRGNQKSYSLRYIDEDGHPGEAFTTIDGQKFAKEKTKELVARDLLRKDDKGTRLRDIFQNLEYNKKGEPKAIAEAVEEIRKHIEKNKEK